MCIDRVKRAPSYSEPPKSQPPGLTEAPRPQVDAQVSIPPKAVPEDSNSLTDAIIIVNYYDPSLPADSDGFAFLDHTLLPEDEHQPEYVLSPSSPSVGEKMELCAIASVGSATHLRKILDKSLKPFRLLLSTATGAESGVRSAAFRKRQTLVRIIPKRLLNRLLTRQFAAARRFVVAPASGNKVCPSETPEKDPRRSQD
ncbi:unnamed protein product [Agarophyton chilense]